MRERKKTAMHGTLEMIPLAWKLISNKLLSKTLELFFFQKRTSQTAKFNMCHLVALGSNGSAYGTPTGFQMVISYFEC